MFSVFQSFVVSKSRDVDGVLVLCGEYVRCVMFNVFQSFVVH